MSETWYRVNREDEISEVEVEYSTEHFVMVKQTYGGKNKREAKDGFAYNYFPTRDEAIRWIIERAERDLDVARANFKDAQDRRDRVRRAYL